MITTAAQAELTSDDLVNIQEIVQETVDKSEKQIQAYVDIKMDGLGKNMNERFKSVDQRFADIDKCLSHQANITYALIALIIVAISIPAWNNRKVDILTALKRR